jgi:peptidoglycan hydrolase-like protein with peptidoglycan-binding domain
MHLAKDRVARDKRRGNIRNLYVKNPVFRGKDVAMVKRAVHHNVYGTGYGKGTARKVKDLQSWWGLRVTGIVNDRTWACIYFYYISKYLGY